MNKKLGLIALLVFVFIGAIAIQNSSDLKVNSRPNIIYIYVDQLSASMMSSSGNKYLKTPAMDYIADNGIRFTRAYTTNPVCSPARVSLMTGRFPSYFKEINGNEVRENGGSMKIPQVSKEVLNTSIGSYLNKAGYELYFGGKEHLPESLKSTNLGFTNISKDEREQLAIETAKVIKADHENPYFMMVSLINPHDICYMAIREMPTSVSDAKLLSNAEIELSVLDSAMKIPKGVSLSEFYESLCPPLPVNYEPQFEEPEAVKQLINTRPMRKNARENFSDNQWRHHRWAYCRLTERVDKEIQVILDALKESGQDKNTLVIFSSDHGDMDGSHRMEHKSTLYEESANIPFMAMWKGHIAPGQINEKELISNGLDILPTLCDYAEIKGMADPRGRSLRPLFEGKRIKWRETLGVESEIGKMVVSNDGYKFIRYDAVGIEEQLINLNEDPYETLHFTNNPKYSLKLKQLRKIFDSEWF
jgi:arylsulfatase A-like enzyme